MPVYETLGVAFPSLKPMAEGVRQNRKLWEEMQAQGEYQMMPNAGEHTMALLSGHDAQPSRNPKPAALPSGNNLRGLAEQSSKGVGPTEKRAPDTAASSKTCVIF